MPKLYLDNPGMVALLILETKEDITQEVWKRPSLLTTIARRVEHIYCVKKNLFNCFSTHFYLSFL